MGQWGQWILSFAYMKKYQRTFSAVEENVDPCFSTAVKVKRS